MTNCTRVVVYSSLLAGYGLMALALHLSQHLLPRYDLSFPVLAMHWQVNLDAMSKMEPLAPTMSGVQIAFQCYIIALVLCTVAMFIAELRAHRLPHDTTMTRSADNRTAPRTLLTVALYFGALVCVGKIGWLYIQHNLGHNVDNPTPWIIGAIICGIFATLLIPKAEPAGA